MKLRWGRPRRRFEGLVVVERQRPAADLDEGFGVAAERWRLSPSGRRSACIASRAVLTISPASGSRDAVDADPVADQGGVEAVLGVVRVVVAGAAVTVDRVGVPAAPGRGGLGSSRRANSTKACSRGRARSACSSV